MQRFVSALILLAWISLVPVQPANAWLFGSDVLLTVDGTEYTTEDFKRWWGFWKEEGKPVPETPDPYIDWLLLSREGKRMELDSAPAFERSTRVFLQSRTLLKLKYEEVDSKIDVTDADVRKRYEERYLPRYVLEGLEFKDDAAAAAALQELNDKKVAMAKLLERPTEEGGPVKTAEMTFRASAIEKKWQATYEELKVGEVLQNKGQEKSKVLWYLKEIKGGDDEDFATLSGDLRSDLRREQESELTEKLIERLRQKYDVKVDEERLAKVDLTADKATLTDDLVITSSRQNFTEKEFVAVMDRVLQSRPMLAGALENKESTLELMKHTAYNVIAQSVTNWESLDREYEKKEPFKWEYDFNYNHRLTLEVQRRLFSEKAQVSDEEISQEYEQNKSRYSIPARVKLYIVDETQGPIDQLWAAVATGKDFELTIKDLLEKSPSLQEVPFNHLDPEVKPVAAKLADGETSQIFSAQGIRVLVHMVQKLPESPIPFNRVKDSIRQELFQSKVAELQKSFLETLKANSTIEVKQRKWKAVQKELGGA